MATDINLDEAQQILIDQVKPLPAETVSINDAYGRIVANNLVALKNLPSTMEAAVDGFALHENNIDGVQPLRIKHYLKFGQITSETLAAGETIGVLTGNPLPIGTAAVVPFEKVKMRNDEISLLAPLIVNSNIKSIGEDIKQGEILANSGTRITAGLIAALVACGVNKPLVYNKPQVAVLTLAPHAKANFSSLQLGEIADSNAPLLTNLINKNGGQARAISYAELQDEEFIENALDKVDLIITSGGTFAYGVSEAIRLLEKWQATPLFWGLKIKPGSHVGAGIYKNKLIICLSGNPMACAVGYELLVNPLLKKMQGLSHSLAKFYATSINEFLCRPLNTPRFILGKANCDENGWKIEILPNQKSSMLRSLINYNAIIEIPAGKAGVGKGERMLVTLVEQ